MKSFLIRADARDYIDYCYVMSVRLTDDIIGKLRRYIDEVTRDKYLSINYRLDNNIDLYSVSEFISDNLSLLRGIDPNELGVKLKYVTGRCKLDEYGIQFIAETYDDTYKSEMIELSELTPEK